MLEYLCVDFKRHNSLFDILDALVELGAEVSTCVADKSVAIFDCQQLFGWAHKCWHLFVKFKIYVQALDVMQPGDWYEINKGNKRFIHLFDFVIELHNLSIEGAIQYLLVLELDTV